MRFAKKVFIALALGLLVPVVFARDAQAYFDAGTISFVLQSIVAAVLVGLIYARSSWRKLMASVRDRIWPKNRRETEDESTGPAPPGRRGGA